ncbi:MAG: CDP-alcohol phosphatidyltransferase family protein [Chlorobi bacterium]|nr:CDP-alcohol phosphatidyltransferase family protein [Chlorobiota bacterium]
MRHLPNILSATRLLIAVPLVWAISTDRRTLAIALGMAALVSDALDGFIARRAGADSELGRVLDPVADKVLAAAVGLTLMLRQVLPVWYVAAIVGRDVLIVVAGAVLARRVGRVPPSLPVGKVAATGIGIVLLAAIIGVPGAVLQWLAVGSTMLLAWSLIIYAARLRQLVRRRNLSN